MDITNKQLDALPVGKTFTPDGLKLFVKTNSHSKIAIYEYNLKQ